MFPVILNGEAPANGKSELSAPLAQRLGLPMILVDDLMLTAKALCTPEPQAALRAWNSADDHAALGTQGNSGDAHRLGAGASARPTPARAGGGDR